MTRWSTAAALDAASRRWGVLRSWPSIGRVAAWAGAWCVILSVVVAPQVPRFTDRDVQPDQPASGVRYVGPVSRTDFAGFLPPEHDPDAFTVAWIGGSEVKLREVSVAGAVEQRIDTVGGRPLLVDGYTIIAPRLIDTIRALDTAADSGADAIVIALNPAWVRPEWGLRGWHNLDVANIGTLWTRPATWSWALAITSPADYGWRIARAVSTVVESQTRLNADARDAVDALDLLDDPMVDPEAPADTGDPRLPPGSDLWLVDADGPSVLTDEDRRVAALIDGIGSSPQEAALFAEVLLDAAAGTGVPVYLYVTPFAPESLAKPEFDAAAQQVEAFWAARQASIDSPLVELEPRSASRDHDFAGMFFNNVHMSNPGPFADVLVARLCEQWRTADPRSECR
jgi:hypothetical protein